MRHNNGLYHATFYFFTIIIFFSFSPVNCQFLEIFGLSTGDAGTHDRGPFQDLATQSVGLMKYLQTVQKNPDNTLAKKLKNPLPSMNLVDGMPVVPGLLGSLPGAGSCLPRGSPLIKDKSPSFFQNILRNIPGAQDYLASLLPAPKVDVRALYGKFQWALDTPSVHNRYCATTEFMPQAESGNSSAFSLQEKFRAGSVDAGEKVAFGYGIIHHERTYVYMQDDPCPYQIVVVGPINKQHNQYEYLILSNWARFPMIGLVRDLRKFYKEYKDQVETDLEKAGFMDDVTGSNPIHYADWSQCKKATPYNYLTNVLTDLFG
ncbi:Lipocalin domain-containing protein [Caenorhabditis elegans]|uniref:LiPocalin-Related protein n=1 Tax=Caenorhabditis elegans TaxID=6239 RepID=B1Q244_CAEEL|nr:LiPocalin-Related protein [Caenorhabditis elegans]CCD73151.1 LiPocalin-Related protein [Caenorhabditis elegans]|eukprot:NP_508134.2 LiPocalin-Related protein [Caenorhabditis elegans]